MVRLLTIILPIICAASAFVLTTSFMSTAGISALISYIAGGVVAFIVLNVYIKVFPIR
jgi:hypothetical protein